MNFELEYILRPLIGSGIGYVTNWIAVKMMFRPHSPIKIGKFTMPFTPGIIPKNRSRLAQAIGNSISTNLLTEETLKNSLLSEETTEKLRNSIDNIMENIKASDNTLENITIKYINEDNYRQALDKISEKVSIKMLDAIKELNLGSLIATQIEEASSKELKSSFLGMIGGGAILNTITTQTEFRINEYIEEDGPEMINNMVHKELRETLQISLKDATLKLENQNINVSNIILNIYEKAIIKNLSNILNYLDISSIVENKINEMDMNTLEELILKIMKKELNALINLGALIGFILGLLNLLF